MKRMYPVLHKNVVLILQPTGGLIGKLGAPATQVNMTAADILAHCDGTVTVAEISQMMAEQHHDTYERVLKLVSHFITDAVQKGHITLGDTPATLLGTIAGNKELWVPIDMSLDITLRCDLQCIHCYAKAGINQKGLPTDKVMSLLEKIHGIGVTKIVLTGGDPPAHPDFLEILKWSTEHFLVVDIATNGYRIDGSLVKKICDLKKGMITARVSIDGNKEMHEKIRGIKGCWDKAVQAVRVFSRHHIPVSVVMTLNSHNVNDLKDVIITAYQCGASRFSAGMTLAKGRAHKSLELTSSQKMDVSKKLKELAQQYGSDTFYISPWVGVSERDILSDTAVNCGAGYRMFAVDSSGNVNPCPAFHYALGNIFENELEDIFTSPLVDFFTTLQWPNPSLCGDCPHFHICTECHADAFVKSKGVDTCLWADQWKNVPK